MDKKKIMLILTSFLFCIFIILFSFKVLQYNTYFYKYEFDKGNVYENLPYADNILENLFDFFKGKETLDITYYDSSQMSHLKDVKNIFKTIDLLFYSLLLILPFLIYHIYKKKELFLFFRWISYIGFFTILFLFLLSLNFSSAFLGFHNLFFPQGNFEFDSSSTLIMLFSENFFLDFFMTMILMSAFFYVLLFIFSIKHLRVSIYKSVKVFFK